MTGTSRPPLGPDLETGFFEDLDRTAVPWRGLGTFRFQAQGHRRVGERVFSREEVDSFTDASYESPQKMKIEGDPRSWWAFEGYWYITHRDLVSQTRRP